MRQSGKLRTSETYRATLNSFMKFMDGKDAVEQYGCRDDGV